MTREDIPPREDILRMSREAGLNMGTIQQYERFTQLVANALAALQSAALREELDHIPDAGKMVGPEPEHPLQVKAERESAWQARDTRCDCDHNEYCKKCWPPEFHEGGYWDQREARAAHNIKEPVASCNEMPAYEGPLSKALTQDLDAPLTLNGVALCLQRQPLTDEECIEAIDASFEFALASGNVSNTSVIRYARAIEAKLKEQP